MSREGKVTLAIVVAIVGAVGVCSYSVSQQPPPPCVTHVPDPEQWSAAAQCKRGAHIEVVDHVALCVCPEANQ